MFKVTQAVNEVLIHAAFAASHYRHDKIEPVHLLIGLVTAGKDRSFDGSGSRAILIAAGLNLESVRLAVGKLNIPTFEGEIMSHAEVYMYSTRDIINAAIRTAKDEDGTSETTGHLAISLIKANDPNVAEVLHQCHVHPGGVLMQLREALPQKN